VNFTPIVVQAMGALLENCWPRLLGFVIIQLYAGECTPR